MEIKGTREKTHIKREGINEVVLYVQYGSESIAKFQWEGRITIPHPTVT